MFGMKKIKWTTTKIIVAGYLFVITVGTLLLMLPIANRQGTTTSFMDAWFTATSATCVTGLVTNDTYSFWSNFGEGVILVLIQIGGIGFMTLAISALTFTGKKIGLSQRLLMKESVAAPHVAVFLNAAADIRKLFPVNKSAPAMITKLSAAANAALCAGFAQIAAVSEVDK